MNRRGFLAGSTFAEWPAVCCFAGGDGRLSLKRAITAERMADSGCLRAVADQVHVLPWADTPRALAVCECVELDRGAGPG